MSASDGSIIGRSKVIDRGPDAVRWNLVVVSEGYRATEMGNFAADTNQFIATLLAMRPFDELQGVINIHRLDVTSTDSGADDPMACGGTGATPATYFDASFCKNGVRRALHVDNRLVHDVV